MKIEELLALIQQKKTEMKAIAENPDMNDEDAEKFDALESEVEKLKAQVKRLEKVQANDEFFKEGTGRKTAHNPLASDKLPAKARDKEQDDRHGFENFAEFAMAVRDSDPRVKGSVDDRLKFYNAPSSTIHKEGGSDDGWMVPPTLKNEVFEVETNDFNILPLVDDEPTASNAVTMLRDETTPWGSVGIQAYWGSEAGQLDRSKLETEGETVKLHKVHALVEVTEELLEDAPRLNSRLTRGSNRALNWKLNQGVFDGDGVGKMLGFRNSGCAVVKARETAGDITAKDVLTMYARSTNPMGGYWLGNRSILPELGTITIGDKPVWMPPSGLAQAPGGVLMGRPVFFAENASYLGTQGDLIFVDPMGYYMPNKGSIKSSQSMHLLFDYDVQVFKWTFRCGGLPYLSAPIEGNKGTAQQKQAMSLSPFIELGDAP